MEHLDKIIWTIVLIGAIFLFIKYRVLPRSKTARKVVSEAKDAVADVKKRTKRK